MSSKVASAATRRGFLGGLAGAAIGGLVITEHASAAPTIADPMLDLIKAYRAETAAYVAGGDGNCNEDMPTPTFDRLCEGDLPAPASWEGAIETLRLAVEEHANQMGDPMTGHLMRAALRFIEGAI